MKISIITSVYNNRHVVEDCLKSVRDQTYNDIEQIMIDGRSTDGSFDILKKYQSGASVLISEKDSGPYEAINKGIKISSGEVIGLLHADDVYAATDSVALVADAFDKSGADTVYGNITYVDPCNTNKRVRYWRAGECTKNNIRKGWMPPHTALFVKKHIYEKVGYFNTSYNIASDYDMVLRLFLENNVSTCYVDQVIVKMRLGGISNRGLRNILLKWKEDRSIIRSYGLGPSTLLMKNIRKIPQFFER